MCRRYFASVGTSVRESKNEKTMANITLSAMGTNRKRATPAQKEHRNEHDADAEQRDEGRDDDLRGAIDDGRFHLLALFEVVVDALDRHRRLIDEYAHGEREPAQAS